MTVPLIVLAVPSILAGFLGSPLAGNAFGQFIHGDAHLDINVGVMAGSTILALFGIGFAWRLYGRTSTDGGRVDREPETSAHATGPQVLR